METFQYEFFQICTDNVHKNFTPKVKEVIQKSIEFDFLEV